MPAIFNLALFTNLTALSGDSGARQILKDLDEKGELAKVPFPLGEIDLDTWEEYEKHIK